MGQVPAAGPRRTLPPVHRGLYQALRFLSRPLGRVYFGLRAEGLEHVPGRGAFVLAANHVSMLDWAYLSYFVPRCLRFFILRELHAQPLVRVGQWLGGGLVLDGERPDPAAVRAAQAVLRAGEPLVVFPEGRISRDGRPQPGRPGVISLATATRTPIVPAALRGAFEVLPRWRRLPRPGRVTVVFGAPLPPPSPAADRRARQELVDRLMRRIAALLDGEALPPQPW